MKVPMPPLRVLIVDDEEPARWRMHQLVEENAEPRCQVVGEASDADAAEAWLADHDCDLILLDIAMPGRDGVALAASLRRAAGNDAPALIFVTAHAEHALKAFELAASDYLTKPVRRERLLAALQRVAEQLALRRRPSGEAAASTAAPDDPPAIVITDRGRVVRVPLDEVLYLKAELKYVTVRTPSHSLVHDQSLAELETRLGPGFLRIHRNALVARSAVRALERRVVAGGDDDGGESWAVLIAEVDEWLAVSRRQVQAVRDALLAAGH
ncbi:LytR/AlgR family response regulator transcription factor [Piscinibacter sakaiensis]|uniref:LytR/AlgR family response regulator transcription factor n=1 Tax=Piscinibacter sakaiensis TaxID=1547922 RepID=UPI003AAE0214